MNQQAVHGEISSSPLSTRATKEKKKETPKKVTKKRRRVESDDEEHEVPSEGEEQSQQFDASETEAPESLVKVKKIVTPKPKTKVISVEEEPDFAVSQTAKKKRRVSEGTVKGETPQTKRSKRKSQKKYEEGKRVKRF